jgi:Sporulation protein YtfJ (Spore_YtfJ)
VEEGNRMRHRVATSQRVPCINRVMAYADLARALGEVFAAGGNVRSVYGEPVTSGQRTVIPVAKVRYAFGAGGGERGGEGGGGGGGRLSAYPCGVVEVTPEGARFIPYQDVRILAIAAAAGFAAGFLTGCLRNR